jgi:hypothetical protein
MMPLPSQKTKAGNASPNAGAAMSRYVSRKRLFCRLWCSVYGRPGGESRKALPVLQPVLQTPFGRPPDASGLAVHNRNWSYTMLKTQSPGASASVQESFQIVHAVLGKHPKDLIWPLDTASDVFLQLTEIFKTISEEKNDGVNAYRIRYLAKAGAYLASDWADFFDCMQEEMKKSFEAFESTKGAQA